MNYETILVAHPLSPFEAGRLRCDHCGTERDATDHEVTLVDVTVDAPCGCGEGRFDWKYVEATPCKNCGKLGFWDESGGACSRVCKLQADYADELVRRTAPVSDRSRHE